MIPAEIIINVWREKAVGSVWRDAAWSKTKENNHNAC